MIEMGTVLIASAILIAIAYQFSLLSKREWGENHKNFF